MTKQETARLLAYDNAKRNRPRNIFSSRRDIKSLKFSAARFQVPIRARKRFILSTEVLDLA